MAYTLTTTMTTKNTNTYETAAAWIAEHGPCGINHSLVVSGQIVADGTGSVTRTLVYENEADRNNHIQARPENLTFDAVFVSESTD